MKKLPETPETTGDFAYEDFLLWAERRLKTMASAIAHGQFNPANVGSDTLFQEAFLLLAGKTVRDREHAIRLARKAMNEILLNRARDARRLKRNPEGGFVSLTDAGPIAVASTVLSDLIFCLSLDALKSEDREAYDAYQHRVGMSLTTADTARELGVSPRTVERRFARGRAALASIYDLERTYVA